MFGLFNRSKKIVEETASHMATLMNLKMVTLKDSLSGFYGKKEASDPYILGWAFGLCSAASKINGLNDRNTGFLQIQIYDLLFGDDTECMQKVIQLAHIKHPVFVEAVEAALREYHPIHLALQNGTEPPVDYFPSLDSYIDQLAGEPSWQAHCFLET